MNKVDENSPPDDGGQYHYAVIVNGFLKTTITSKHKIINPNYVRVSSTDSLSGKVYDGVEIKDDPSSYRMTVTINAKKLDYKINQEITGNLRIQGLQGSKKHNVYIPVVSYGESIVIKASLTGDYGSWAVTPTKQGIYKVDLSGIICDYNIKECSLDALVVL